MIISGYVNRAVHPGSGTGSHDAIKDRFNAALLNAKHGSSCHPTIPDTDGCPPKSPPKCKSGKSKKSKKCKSAKSKKCKSGKSKKSAYSVKSVKCHSAKSKKSVKCKSAKSKKSNKSRKSSKHC